MAEYRAPLRDIRFVLDHVVDLVGLSRLPEFSHVDAETVDGVLEEGGRFMSEVIAPLDQVGDRHGARFDGAGVVSTAPGFADAYRRYVDGGWGGVAFPTDFGGGGFPWVVGLALQEMLTSANMAFSLCPLLTHGASEMLVAHGSDDQRHRFLSRMVSGEWTGTMNLTEPEAGSDLGALRTRAVAADDGTWRIFGTKIFITWGEHDLAGNIVHLVLARPPGAPAGTRGISCFIVPKYLVGPDGAMGGRNDVRCVSVEHKMGIHASPTCTMAYGDEGGAVGHLVGDGTAGMGPMFTMMNNARLSVGIQGLAVAERSYQQAGTFAGQRRQGRAVGAAPGHVSLIVEHPDVRRMLLTMKASVEAMRCLLYVNAEAVDLARHHPDQARRHASQELVELLTPVSKAWCTDLGVEVCSTAVQVHGGMGYVEETGVAQHLRDARIAPIYEGTNGIQAVDLVSRKLPLRGGAAVGELLARMSSVDQELAEAGGELAATRAALADGVDTLRRATGWLLERRESAPADVLAGATPYLRMSGLVTGGWLMARSALAAMRCRSGGEGDAGFLDARSFDAAFLDAKVTTARFYCEQILPQASGLLPSVTGGAGALFAIDAKHLGT